MEDKIIIFLSKIISTQNLKTAKEQTNTWYSSIQSTLNPKEKDTFLLIFVKTLRLLYQNELNSLLTKGTLNDFGSFFTSYSLWLNQIGIIDFMISLTLLEDIIETYPIDHIEAIYSIMEDFLKSKTQNEIDERKIIILKITNIMLKRLSSSLDTKLRGRVQMLLSTIFKLSEKSGVNLKGVYNINNSSSWNNIQSNAKIPNVQFYKQFWLLHRYLTNPILLFPAYAQQDNSSEMIELLQEEQMFSNANQSRSETISIMDVENSGININNNANSNKIEIFLANIKRILIYFQLNPIDIILNNKVTHSLLSYPKYLTHPELFDLQLNDSEFRRTLLIQFTICLKAFLKPVSQLQKNCFVFNEEVLGKINDTIKLCFCLLDQYGSDIKNIFDNETHWEKWKESSCQTFEKICNEGILNQFDKVRQATITSPIQEERPNIFKSKIKIDNRAMNSYDFSKEFSITIEDIQNINVQLEVDTINSEVPYLGTFIERVLSDEDPSSELDFKDKTIEKDTSFAWKFLKLLAENDINRIISSNSNVLSICKDINEKFKSKTNTLVFSSHQPLQEKVASLPMINQTPPPSLTAVNQQQLKMPPQTQSQAIPMVQISQSQSQVTTEINLNNINNNININQVPKQNNHIIDSKQSETEVIKDDNKEEEKRDTMHKEKNKGNDKEIEINNERKGRNDKDKDNYLLSRKRNIDHSYDKVMSNNSKKHKSN